MKARRIICLILSVLMAFSIVFPTAVFADDELFIEETVEEYYDDNTWINEEELIEPEEYYFAENYNDNAQTEDFFFEEDNYDYIQPEEYVFNEDVEDIPDEVFLEESSETAGEIEGTEIEIPYDNTQDLLNLSDNETFDSASLHIVSQPRDTYSKAGVALTTSIEAEGEGLTYTWYYKRTTDTNFRKSNKTTNVFNTNMKAEYDGMLVYCVVTDANGNSEQSDTVTIYLGSAVEIVSQPRDTYSKAGVALTTSIEAEGEGLTYTWYYKRTTDTNFRKSNKTTNVFNTNMKAEYDGMLVYCVVTDANGNSEQSDTVTIYLGSAVEIVTQPKNELAKVGDALKIAIKAEGEGLTYTWYYKRTTDTSFKKSNKTTENFNTTMKAEYDGMLVYCIVADDKGNSETSEVVTVTLDRDRTIDDVIYSMDNNGSWYVKKYTGTASTVTIVDDIDGVSITAIGEEAFMGNVYLTSITLPSTVTVIKARAFKGCVNLSQMN